MNVLVLSTLPHYVSILPLIHYKEMNHYNTVIVTSSTLSVLFHTYDNKFLTFLDYFVALIWFLYDIQLGIQYQILSTILYLNFTVVFININITNNYEVVHSLWHLISACKCYYICNLIHIKIQQQQH